MLHVSRRSRLDASTALETNTLATAGAAPTQQAAAAAVAPAAPAKPAAATAAELRAACPKASADFILAQIEAGATVASATTAYNAELLKQLEAKDKQLADAAAAKPAEANRGPGVKPLPAATRVDASTDGSAAEQVEELVAAEMKRTGKPKHEATRAVFAKNPELRQQLVAEHNAANRRR
jgi:hypothetical protein